MLPVRTHATRRLLAAPVALTVITLSTALAAFSFGGLAVEGKRATFRDEPWMSATSDTAPGNPNAMSAGQQSKELIEKLEEAPDIAIQFVNSSDAPLTINAASIRAVKAPLSEGRPPNRYMVRPDVQLQNATNRRVTGLVLSFRCGCSKAAETCSGEGGLDLTPGAEYRFKMKPQSDSFALDGDPNLLRVSVAAVLLEGEDLWVNVDQTRRVAEGTRAVRSDSGSSKASSSFDASSRQVDDEQSEPRASVGANVVSDALCNGEGCPLSLIKDLGAIIGLPVVFEASAEARVKKAVAFHLRNLRRGDVLEILLRLNNLRYSRSGDRLNVRNDDLSESLYRLKLSN